MAALTVRISARALGQLYGMLDFIALDNPEAADRISRQAEQALERLRTYPDLGPVVFENLPHREIKVYPLRIIIKREGRTLWVVAVVRV